jgi:hypothetical protein
LANNGTLVRDKGKAKMIKTFAEYWFQPIIKLIGGTP